MTKNEAIKYLGGWNLSKCDDNRVVDIRVNIGRMNEAIVALRGPQPDGETGLMPCGCGGKAAIWGSDATRFTKIITDYEVGCTECDMTTGWVRGDKKNAMKVWNKAMGCKEDA